MKYIYFLLLIICFGCSTKNINYDRNKIIEKYNTDYKFFLNGEEIVFENFFLNKNNIDRIIVDKRSKIVIIYQKLKTNLLKLKDYNMSSLLNESFEIENLNCQNCFIIIDGIPHPINIIGDIYFEENLISDIKLIRETSFNKMPLIIVLNK